MGDSDEHVMSKSRRKRQRLNHASRPRQPLWRFEGQEVCSTTNNNETKGPGCCDCELLRLQCVRQLRECMDRTCLAILGHSAPRNCFNRWFMERRLVQTSCLDPLLPSFPADETSPALYRELKVQFLQYPKHLRDSSDVGKAAENLCTTICYLCDTYAPAMPLTTSHDGILGCHTTEPAHQNDVRSGPLVAISISHKDMKDLRTAVDNCKSFFSLSPRPSKMALMCSLDELYQTARDILKPFIKPLVRSVCERVAKETAELIQEACSSISSCPHSVSDDTLVPTLVDRIASESQSESSLLVIQYKDICTVISSDHLHKLSLLFHRSNMPLSEPLAAVPEYSSPSSPSLMPASSSLVSSEPTSEPAAIITPRAYDSHFLRSVWIMLIRYQILFGSDSSTGSEIPLTAEYGFHAAVPSTVFDFIVKHLGVTTECFSSPLNCYLSRFCSAFYDTDSAFGSLGSFFDFHPKFGSFEVNPPFEEQMILKMFNHILDLLGSSEQALSFIIFIPNWSGAINRKLTNGSPHMRMVATAKDSRWFRGDWLIPAFEHIYIHGNQHLIQQAASSRQYFYRATHATYVLLLQTDAAAEKWPTDETFWRQLQDSMGSPNEG
eukprot:GILK01012675.1.p1 GENE.GILK01012675.1~~GILK01012675.1.p1  ORF type:complete len:616 (+),score=72.30 GILK01012675.1:27-1850(+)